MSSRFVCVTVALLSFASLATPRVAQASNFHGRLHAGVAHLRNDLPEGADSSGLCVATQLDLGVRLTPALALHGTLFADESRWLGFEPDFAGGQDMESSVYGFGVGATASWRGLSLGVATGAQFTWYPDQNDPSSSPYGAGIGPFFSFMPGYVIDAFDVLQVGVHGLARYRWGKDEGDPAGYQLGMLLSIGVSEEPIYR